VNKFSVKIIPIFKKSSFRKVATLIRTEKLKELKLKFYSLIRANSSSFRNLYINHTVCVFVQKYSFLYLFAGKEFVDHLFALAC
jgi:hypothetical protein